MDRVFGEFREAYEKGDGYGLSMTLSPIDPPSQPNRLSSFFQSTNAASASKDFRYRILYDNSASFKLSNEEGNGWVEVYFAYWKSVGEILSAEDATQPNAKVSRSPDVRMGFPCERLELRGLVALWREMTLLFHVNRPRRQLT